MGVKDQPENPQQIDSDSNVADQQESVPQYPEAEVIAVEMHPKLADMYRVIFRFRDSHGEPLPDARLPISLDGNILTVHEDTLVAMRLIKGRRLSGEEWQVLLQKQSGEEAYQVALAMLNRKARTRRELADALKRKGFETDVIQACLGRLQKHRLVDDAAYAIRFAEQRTASHRKGSRLIRQELLQRGIAKKDAEQALAAIDPHLELEAAYALARKKWPLLKGDMRTRQMKLTGYLLRRGYAGSVVRKVLERVIEGVREQNFDIADAESDPWEWDMSDAEPADLPD
jgi:SOS response regulatory protein OraA/RecX